MKMDCLFCSKKCANGCCSSCSELSRNEKWNRLLRMFGEYAKSVIYHDEMCSLVKRIQQVESLMGEMEFRPVEVFNEEKHTVDLVALEYLGKIGGFVSNMIPVKVEADGNCLYNSILLLMGTSPASISELRVRTLMELITNEAYYSNKYTRIIGPIDAALQSVCEMDSFSELYEVAALCNVLKCGVQSVFPSIIAGNDLQPFNHFNTILTPVTSISPDYKISLLWCHTRNEITVRAVNGGNWSPNHFVPLLLGKDQSKSIPWTPEKTTIKNNSIVQVRVPEFDESSSRRLRTEIDLGNNTSKWKPSTLRSTDTNSVEQERQILLARKRERMQIARINETEAERQSRLEIEKDKSRNRRKNETEQQYQYRLEKAKDRIQLSRNNETQEQREFRLAKQRERSKINREKKKAEKYGAKLNEIEQVAINVDTMETETNETHVDTVNEINLHVTTNKRLFRNETNASLSVWPERVSRVVKERCLKKFINRMSMSELCEVVCAVCNIRCAVKNSKKIPLSKIPNIDLLKVPDELQSVLQNIPQSCFSHLNDDTTTTKQQNSTYGIRENKDSTTLKSSSFYLENDVLLYTDGLFLQNRTKLCTLCQKCYDSLLHEKVPKFSVANDMWLGNVPIQLQDLTIPEEKLISLYRHNSCIIKLQSPFYSVATAQTALKGNCITFLQNLPNIVSSLPLSLDDLCDTLKIIFVGARPPERIHLRKILTVRKKKIVEALSWLKQYNILYKNIEINLRNIAQLPDDDVPESIMSTMQQNISQEENQSERVGYIPDPLDDPTEYINADSIPINTRQDIFMRKDFSFEIFFFHSGVLDVNGSMVSSDDIASCLLHKLKNDKTQEETTSEHVFIIPHSANPVNEYFNPKLLAGLYPTLFCYGRGVPESQSRLHEISLREHIRYLLSYNDRRFETNYSFMFVVFNILQRRDACFHAKLIATKPYFKSSAQEIQLLKSDDIETALKNIAEKTYDAKANKTISKLVNHIKTVGGRVMGSTYSRMTLRTKIHSLIFNQGLPSIFLTLNPADVHSPVALYFAGVKLDLDNIKPELLVDTYKRAEIIASHPVATAKFFHVLITSILDTMITGGVLGPIKAYFGTVESQGRGSLHLHMLIWIDHDLKPANMKEKIQNRDFCEKLIAYLEDIIKEDLDEFKEPVVTNDSNNTAAKLSPPRSLGHNIYTALRTIDLTDLQQKMNPSNIWSPPTEEQLSLSTTQESSTTNRFLHTIVSNRLTITDNTSSHESKWFPVCQPTPNPSALDFQSLFRADVVKLVQLSNVHKHNDTCYKYNKDNRNDNKTCRMRMPRKLIARSTIDQDTGHISMRRSDPWINNFNPYLIVACRSNMDIKFIWSGSDAKALVYYITDYVTKMNLSFHDTFSLIQKSITSIKDVTDHTYKEDAIEKSRKLVLRCYNTLASQQELSGVQVASYLMNWDDHYTTHKFQGLYLSQTERFLQMELDEMRRKQNLAFESSKTLDDSVSDDESIDEEQPDEEQFQVELSENKKDFVLVNTRIDYQYRSNSLNNISLYEFVSMFYKKKINAGDLKHLSRTIPSEDQSIQKGRPPNERYRFQKEHPQAGTYLMMKYSEPHVPVLYGPQIPRRDRDDTRERYSRALLTLFVPWRTVSDLCDTNQNWQDALESRQSHISKYSSNIIENIQLLHECKKERDEHLIQVITENQTESNEIDPVLLPSGQNMNGEHEDPDDVDDLLELLSKLDEYTTVAIGAKTTSEREYIEETIKVVENVGRFNHIRTYGEHMPDEAISHSHKTISPFVTATSDLVQLNSQWQDQLKTEKERIRRCLITGVCDNSDNILSFDITDPVVTVVNSNKCQSNSSDDDDDDPILPVVSIKTSFPSQKSVADEYTLNREQRAAFMIITSHLDIDNDKRHNKDDNKDQLIMCIPGCGGTGKSQLIRAITKYFLITQRIQKMRKLAPTGIAAAEIDGMTIHSFLGEQRNSRKSRTIKPGDSKLEQEWRLVEYLLIDEMSMVGLTLLAKLNRIMSAAKHVDPQIPFGGVNVIFFGDYLQYRPVFDAPLYTDFSMSSRKKSNKSLTEKEIQQRVARSLILQINCVVKLTRQMRTEDCRYLELLDRLRQGQCNYDDYELLLTRVVGQPSVESLQEDPWNKAPILVFRNEVRSQLNHRAVIHDATQLGYTPMVCVAQDSCKGKPIEDPVLKKKLLELPDSKTEHLPGYLPLVPGMPVILTQNIAIELGLINGMNGIFRQLVYQANPVSTDICSEAFPNNTQYIYRPLYALIEIPRSKIECNLTGLPSKLVPIPLMDQTYHFNIADFFPNFKNIKVNRKAILSIRRRALPLVPAYSITTHKSQGQTLNKVIIDLKLPNDSDDIAAIYVPLSRVKRLKDVIILRHFDQRVLLMKPSKAQLAEIERLDQLYRMTQIRFSEWFQ